MINTCGIISFSILQFLTLFRCLYLIVLQEHVTGTCFRMVSTASAASSLPLRRLQMALVIRPRMGLHWRRRHICTCRSVTIPQKKKVRQFSGYFCPREIKYHYIRSKTMLLQSYNSQYIKFEFKKFKGIEEYPQNDINLKEPCYNRDKIISLPKF